jgi:hypothetical protein
MSTKLNKVQWGSINKMNSFIFWFIEVNFQQRSKIEVNYRMLIWLQNVLVL